MSEKKRRTKSRGNGTGCAYPTSIAIKVKILLKTPDKFPPLRGKSHVLILPLKRESVNF